MANTKSTLAELRRIAKGKRSKPAPKKAKPVKKEEMPDGSPD